MIKEKRKLDPISAQLKPKKVKKKKEGKINEKV